MTGRNVEYVFPPRPASRRGEEVLRVEGSRSPGAFADVSFSVRAGEIVGLAGLVGSGRSEILGAVYGARPASGRVVLAGKPVRRSVVGNVRRGMGLAPEERKAQALLLDQSVTANITLGSLPSFAKLGWMNRARERAEARPAGGGAGHPARPTRSGRSRTLSGGNQQKAVLARWLLGGRKLLLLDEPTRGVDVGARAELYAVIRGWPTGASGCCWSPARCRRCSASPTACWCCARARSSTRRTPANSTSTACST